MCEDICNLAEDKHVAFIIIPFHKQQTMDEGMQVANAAFRSINQNVLANAPCLVGILVDRGLTGSTRLGASNQVSHQVDVLFFGGADDRVALSYAWRMSEHHRISLTVMQFIAGDNAIDPMRVETSAEPNFYHIDNGDRAVIEINN
ncbi:Cation/H(+) antiporter 15 [Camellia lanceoleosa]|uniref:Cation/H(+) antiporter 15 n=1 Tax=Camellia lanceoleosa TaxID=1840588 RepID=A0ACC0FLV5_9ERIC|nr:Cation/H(+) antiporter 15 [Camellia lanceoleosa]